MKYFAPGIFERFYDQLRQVEWEETDFDGQPMLMLDHGAVCLSVWPKASPVEWSIVLLPLDDFLGGRHFVIEGTSDTVEDAKAETFNQFRIRELMDKAMSYLLGELQLESGPSIEPRLR